MTPLRIGSLFSGYGGLDMAVQDVIGGEVVWHSDIKPASRALLAHRHPEIPNLGDLKFIHWPRTLRDHGPIDVLAGSTPCQPHSSAGKRLGEDDPRALWPYVVRAVAAVRPAVFFGENVARIAVNGELRRVVRTLADLGYVGAWWCNRASDVGAPHRRPRCFIVAVDATAHPGGEAGAQRAGLRAGGAPGLRRGRPDHRPGAAGAGSTSNVTLLTSVQTLIETQEPSFDWGKYTEAITHWTAVFGREAPPPIQIGPRGGRQLVPAFVEWMMGLPAGWVTDVPGLTRAKQLSLLGDGVVPQQGAAAFRFLLDHLAERLDPDRAA